MALNISDALSQNVVDKRIDVLQRIKQFGSISEAARSAGISYKAAWQAIETLSALAGDNLPSNFVKSMVWKRTREHRRRSTHHSGGRSRT